jgi:hypothetical protein
MLKKLYKKNGIIMISVNNDYTNTNMKLNYALINKILKKDFYKTLGYSY